MGLIYADLLVTNYRDLANAEDHFIQPDQIRQKEVTFLVDTGAYLSVLPQSLCDELGLRITGSEQARYADGRVQSVGVTEAIELRFRNRTTVIQAMVIGDEPLLGATTMQLMDVVANPVAETLEVNPAHPDQPLFRI